MFFGGLFQRCLIPHAVGFEVDDFRAIIEQVYAIEHTRNQFVVDNHIEGALAPELHVALGLGQALGHGLVGKATCHLVDRLRHRLAKRFQLGRCRVIHPLDLLEYLVNGQAKRDGIRPAKRNQLSTGQNNGTMTRRPPLGQAGIPTLGPDQLRLGHWLGFLHRLGPHPAEAPFLEYHIGRP